MILVFPEGVARGLVEPVGISGLGIDEALPLTASRRIGLAVGLQLGFELVEACGVLAEVLEQSAVLAEPLEVGSHGESVGRKRRGGWIRK